jgi:hypothetical protein
MIFCYIYRLTVYENTYFILYNHSSIQNLAEYLDKARCALVCRGTAVDSCNTIVCTFIYIAFRGSVLLPPYDIYILSDTVLAVGVPKPEPFIILAY